MIERCFYIVFFWEPEKRNSWLFRKISCIGFSKASYTSSKKNSMNFSERNINLRMFLDFDRNISVFWLKNSDSLFDFAFYVSRGTFQKKSYNNQNCSRFFPKNLGPLWKVSGSFVKTAFYLSKAILRQKKFEKKIVMLLFLTSGKKFFMS